MEETIQNKEKKVTDCSRLYSSAISYNLITQGVLNIWVNTESPINGYIIFVFKIAVTIIFNLIIIGIWMVLLNKIYDKIRFYIKKKY